MSTYVYCLIAAKRRPSLARVPRGLPGTGRVRLLEVVEPDAAPNARRRRLRSRSSDLDPLTRWLAVGDAPANRYHAAAIERRLSDLDWVGRAAIAHEAVIESFIEAPALLPMKLFTIFNSDARVLEYVRHERARIDRLLHRVAGHHEWGVRMTMAASRRSARPPIGRRRAHRTGTGYLSLKKVQRDAASEERRQVRRVAGALYTLLEGHAAASRRRDGADIPIRNGPLVLDAAFLVPRSRSSRFRALLRRESKTLTRQGYRMTMSGPWPPYSFVQD